MRFVINEEGSSELGRDVAPVRFLRRPPDDAEAGSPTEDHDTMAGEPVFNLSLESGRHGFGDVLRATEDDVVAWFESQDLKALQHRCLASAIVVQVTGFGVDLFMTRRPFVRRYIEEGALVVGHEVAFSTRMSNP